MTTPLNPYPAYKPSGVEWLGDVPRHWEVVQLGRIGVFSKGSGGTKDDEVPDGIPCVRYGDLYTTHTHFIRRTRSFVSPARASAYSPINRGDVLFPTSGETIEDIGKSAVNLMHTQVLCGGDLIVFRPMVPMEPKFAGYSLDCHSAQTQKSLMGRGITIMHVYSAQLKYFRLPLPPLPEQHAIVRYLDHVDRRIRRYIGAKQKLITLLEEERQAVINQAVTRGLDPNVRFKPSGVEWLGDVPEHWEMQRLKQISVIQTGITLGKNYGDEELIESPYLRVANVQSGRLDLSRVTTVRVPPAEIRRATLKTGDVLMTEGGDIDKLGRGCIWLGDIPGCLHQNHIFAVRPKLAILNPAFLVAVMGSCHGRIYFEVTAKRTTNLATTNRTTLGNLPMYLPGVIEQQAILDHIAEQCGLKDAAIAQAHRQVELVQEYRTRLIADVVTGKLDVRDVAAQLPDEVDDEEPMDESGPLADSVAEDLYDPDESVEELAMESEVTV